MIRYGNIQIFLAELFYFYKIYLLQIYVSYIAFHKQLRAIYNYKSLSQICLLMLFYNRSMPKSKELITSLVKQNITNTCYKRVCKNTETLYNKGITISVP